MADYLFLGALKRDFILPPGGKPLLDVPGGNVAYAAAGAALWGARPGLVARVGEDFPRRWLQEFQQRGWDVSGVRILPQRLEDRRVRIYDPTGHLSTEQPLNAFTRRKVPFPKALLNYRVPSLHRAELKKPTDHTLRLSDLPPHYGEAHGAHFSPYDYLTHNLLPAALRNGGVPFITLEPHPAYMSPLFFDDLPPLFHGLTAVLVPEATLRALFSERTADLWEMAATVGQWQVEFVIVRRARGDVWVYESRPRRRWVVAGYPATPVDPTGAGDAFSGAFLVALRETLDVVQATVRGAATASLAVETRGVNGLLESLPALLHARAEVIARQVRQV